MGQNEKARVDSLAESDTGPASVLVDEHDAARIQCGADFSYRFASPAQFSVRRFEPSDRWF
jgi:hypothetical protein